MDYLLIKKVFKDKFNNLNLTIDELFIFCGDNINKLFNKYKNQSMIIILNILLKL